MSKKKNVKPTSLPKFNWKDERIPKVVGVISVLTAIYLAIAFMSYIYTWKQDQDKVLQFSWSLLTQSELVASNWLGRLGAIISNAFFYWGFGLPSMIFVVLLTRLGFDLIRQRPLGPFWLLTRNSLIIMSFFSLLLEFVFRKSEFTWGGAFGESTCFWLTNFLGQVGLFFLLLFTIGTWFFWKYNPNLSMLTIENPFRHVEMPTWDFFKPYDDDADDITSNISTKKEKQTETAVFGQKPSESEWDLPIKTGNVTENKNIQSSSRNFQELEFDLLDRVVKSQPVTSAKADLDLDIQFPPSAEDDDSPMFETIPLPSQSGIGQIPVSPETEIEAVKMDDLTEVEPYDPTADLSRYKYPTIDLLLEYSDQKVEIDRDELEANKDQII
jgi:S-DNA-T family DNA segregation ATPase FtsK/SpoIIIE